VLYYPGPKPSDADGQLARRVADELVGCRQSLSAVVRIDGGHSGDAAALNMVMMGAYLDDLVDFYLVVFAGTPAEHSRFGEENSTTSL